LLATPGRQRKGGRPKLQVERQFIHKIRTGVGMYGTPDAPFALLYRGRRPYATKIIQFGILGPR
jgi:hypothetical protein